MLEKANSLIAQQGFIGELGPERQHRLVTSTLSKSHFWSSTFLLFLLHCLMLSLCGCNFSNFSVDTIFSFHSWVHHCFTGSKFFCLCILLFSFILLFFLISLKMYTSHSYLFRKNSAEYSSSRWSFFYCAISVSFSPWVSSLQQEVCLGTLGIMGGEELEGFHSG